jgi:Skp family chaperone for outer membrane proteins
MMKFGAAVAALAVAVGLPAVLPARGQTRPDAPAGRPSAIKTVDLVKAFNSMLQKTEGDNDIRDLKEKLEKDAQNLANELEQLRKELDLYKKDTPEYRQTEEKVLRKVSEVAAQGDFVERRLLLEQRLKTLQIYSALRKGVEDYAKSNNIALDLMTDEPNLLDARSQQELLSKISLRKVIYAHESMDITRQIIEQVNADYLRDKKAKDNKSPKS